MNARNLFFSWMGDEVCWLWAGTWLPEPRQRGIQPRAPVEFYLSLYICMNYYIYIKYHYHDYVDWQDIGNNNAEGDSDIVTVRVAVRSAGNVLVTVFVREYRLVHSAVHSCQAPILYCYRISFWPLTHTNTFFSGCDMQTFTKKQRAIFRRSTDSLSDC